MRNEECDRVSGTLLIEETGWPAASQSLPALALT